MIYFTGDIHGDASGIRRYCLRNHLSEDDIFVILGDVGANYFGDERDAETKRTMASLKPTIFCIHGNHEQRPAKIPGYELIEWKGGKVWRQEQYPNLLFAKDGEIFDFDGLRYLVIGGAYSVDKFYRLSRGLSWWPDEQPSEEIKAFVEQQIREKSFDVVLSHTCPYHYEPTEMFIVGIDQSTVDTSTEEWLDAIEAKIDYIAWFCGHWHTDKHIDKMHFLFQSVETAAQFR